MSAMPRKQRRMIRQGISHGLQSKVGGPQLLKVFYFVYSSSLRNLRTPALLFVYFEHLFYELEEQGESIQRWTVKRRLAAWTDGGRSGRMAKTVSDRSRKCVAQPPQLCPHT